MEHQEKDLLTNIMHTLKKGVSEWERESLKLKQLSVCGLGNVKVNYFCGQS